MSLAREPGSIRRHALAKENTTQAAPLKERRGFFADCLIEGGMNAGATPTKWARF